MLSAQLMFNLAVFWTKICPNLSFYQVIELLKKEGSKRLKTDPIKWSNQDWATAILAATKKIESKKPSSAPDYEGAIFNGEYYGRQ